MKKVIPTNWIYEKTRKIVPKKHFLAYYHRKDSKSAPPSELLKFNKGKKVTDNEVHKIYVYKIIGKI